MNQRSRIWIALLSIGLAIVTSASVAGAADINRLKAAENGGFEKVVESLCRRVMYRLKGMVRLHAAAINVLSAGCANTLPTTNGFSPLRQPDLAPVVFKSAPAHKPVELVKDGKAVGVIYIAPAVSTDQRGTAFDVLLEEMHEVIELTTGAKLPVVTQLPAPDVPAIIIGTCEASEAEGIRSEELPYESFVVKTAPNRVYLVGSTRTPEYAAEMAHHNERWPGGALNQGDAWAVADFLERVVGVRWYWPEEALGRSIIKKNTLAVPAAHYNDAPVFRYRTWVYWRMKTIPVENLKVGRWFDKTQLPHPVPEGVEKLTPPWMQLRQGTSWPHWIRVHSLPISEERTLCSRELVDYMLKGAEQYWDKNITRGGYLTGGNRIYVTPDAIHFSYPDGGIRTEHIKAECRDMLKGRTWNKASEVMGRTLKMLAGGVKRRWPDKKVLYLPYWQYVMAPDIEFPDNLEIQLCLTHTDGMAGMAEPGKRAMNDRNIESWSEKAGGKITLWDYAAHGICDTFAPVQFPFLIQDFYQQHQERLAGAFVDSAAPPLWAKGAPTAYVWMRLLWNPNSDVDAILDEWCRRQFGPAAETTRKLLQLMCDSWEKSTWTRRMGESVGLGGGGVVFSDKWPPEVVAQMDALRKQVLVELEGDEEAQMRFQYWMGDDQWAAFLAEAEATWEVAGVIPKKPRITSFRFPDVQPKAEVEILHNVGGQHREGHLLFPFERRINVTVPAGTDVTALRPHIYADMASIDPPSGTPQDFSKPVTYTVTYDDNGATAQYVVVVKEK